MALVSTIAFSVFLMFLRIELATELAAIGANEVYTFQATNFHLDDQG